MVDDDTLRNIRLKLYPLKRGSGDLGPFVDGTIALAKLLSVIPPTTAKMISNREKRFKKALATLGDDCPESARQILPTYAKQRISGRLDPLQEFCASQAAIIVSHFSSEPLTATQSGPVHNISKIIFEAATGCPTSDTALLKAVRREVARRKKAQ
jgi:hypothetical protein